MQKITPFLWFDQQAEEAANFYVGIFDRSSILRTTRYGKAGPQPEGTVMTVVFQIEGQEFTALNGGPHFQFNEAVSFVVHCSTQEEVDRYWSQLSGEGEESHCGWLKDRFGVSWQIVPKQLSEWSDGRDPAAFGRMMGALLQMRKLDIDALQRAYDGK